MPFTFQEIIFILPRDLKTGAQYNGFHLLVDWPFNRSSASATNLLESLSMVSGGFSFFGMSLKIRARQASSPEVF
jgi:hypothetical protein